MTTHMTVHARIGDDWVYVPGALVDKWAVYDSPSDCAKWKGKMKDVLGDGILVQCVPANVKAKFDNPGEAVVEVVQEVIPPPEEHVSSILLAAAVVSCVILALGARLFYGLFQKTDE